MDNKLKTYWIAHQILDKITTVATTIFVDFYIWESTKSFNAIITFNLGLFIILPLAVLLSAFLTELLDLKLVQAIAKFFQVVFMILLLTLGVELIKNPFAFGLLAGLITGLAFAPADIITGKTPPAERLDINSKIRLGSILVGLSIPFLFAQFVGAQSNFNLPFIVAAIIHVLLFIATLLVSFPALDKIFSLSEVFSFPGTNPGKVILAKSSFLLGLKDSIHYSLIGVLTLNFIGSITGWGWFKLALTVLSLLITLIYKKLSFAKQSILPLGLGAVIFFLGSVYFAYDFTLSGIYVYASAVAVFEVFFGFGIFGTMARLGDLETSRNDLTAEYTFFSSFFSSLGMIIPIVILYYFQPDLSSPLAFLIVVSASPLFLLPSSKP